MRSYQFPQMFNTNSSRIWRSDEYLEATQQNAIILLHCERGELACDPYFGLMLKHFLFNQNNFVLRDQIIDVIYTQLAIFMPQIKVRRQDIEIIQDKEKGKLYCNFHGISQIDYQVQTYNLVLLENTENY